MPHLQAFGRHWRAGECAAVVLAVVVAASVPVGERVWVPTGRVVAAAQRAAAPGRTVWSGVYTVEQAARGKLSYDTYCSSCHGPELGGADGPPLVGDDFLRNWLEDDLNSLYVKVHRRMPADAPGSLSEGESMDVVSYLLRSNEFPPGVQELRPDEGTLSAIRIENKSGPGPVPNFSLVSVVGCLNQRPDSEWVLTRGTDPVRTRDGGPDPNSPGVSSKTLGTQIFRLMDIASSRPENYRGQVVRVKGLLMRQPDETRVNVTSLQGSGSACPS